MHCKAGPKATLGHLGNYERLKARSSNPISVLKPVPVEDHTLQINLTGRDRLFKGLREKY